MLIACLEKSKFVCYRQRGRLEPVHRGGSTDEMGREPPVSRRQRIDGLYETRGEGTLLARCLSAIFPRRGSPHSFPRTSHPCWRRVHLGQGRGCGNGIAYDCTVARSSVEKAKEMRSPRDRKFV